MSEQIFSEAELTRRNQLIGYQLSPDAQTILRCADCILSRFAHEGSTEPAGILLSDLNACTGKSNSIVTSTFKALGKAGFTERRQLPPDSLTAQLYGSSRSPLLVVPRPNGDGEHFFRPERRPGCERTTQHSMVDSMRDPTRQVLEMAAAHTGRALAPEFFVAQGVSPKPVQNALKIFTSTQMSEDTGEGYKLTDRGLWLAQGLEPKRWGTKRLEPPPVSSRRMQRIQDQEAPPSPPHPRPIESVTKGVVEDWIKALVLKRYSVEEARTIIRALHTLISSGILEISAQRFPYRRRDGERLHQPHGERRLEFSQFVLDNAFRYERQALLIGFNIVSLFYKTEELSLSSIAQDLCLRSQDEVGPHGIKVIYRQLLDLRQAQQ